MAGDPYCGNCHTWMRPHFIVHEVIAPEDGDVVEWYCECPVGQEDTSKDPNCHNSLHEHHDPQSPIVLSRIAEYEAEERTVADSQPAFGVREHVIHTGSPCETCGALITEEPERPLADDEGTICGHERVDGRCNFWGCPVRLANKAAKERMYEVAAFDSATGRLLGWRLLNDSEIDEETRAALDAILKEANEKVDTNTYLQERAED